MRSIRSIVGLLLVGTAAVALLASGAFADTTNNYIISAINGTQQGWTSCGTRLQGNEMCSRINGACKGNAGPAPCGNLGFETCEISGSGEVPAQAWVGTNKYNGIKLVDIKKLSYWTILDWRGTYGGHLCDQGAGYDPARDPNDTYRYHCFTDPDPKVGNWIPDTDHERSPTHQSQFNSNPPQIQLHVWINNGEDQRLLVYRPWGKWGDGSGNQCRKWQEWDCLSSRGEWLISEQEGTFTGNWEDILYLPGYENAYISTTTVYTSGRPAWTEDQSPCEGRTSTSQPLETYGTPFNIVLGGRAAGSRPGDPDAKAWWAESYWARGAVDLLTVTVGEGETATTDVYDFDVLNTVRRWDGQTNTWTYTVEKPPNTLLCLNNKAVFEQKVYMPDPRIAFGAPQYWQGGSQAVARASQNAVQRYSYYGDKALYWGAYGNPSYYKIAGTTTGNLYVAYGVVENLDGNEFTVDDGAGLKLPCYCGGREFGFDVVVSNGDYVRMVGSLSGNMILEWLYNEYHYVRWIPDPDPLVRAAGLSQPWPWRFDITGTDVTVLVPAP